MNRPPVLLVALLAAGCAQAGDKYPSLAPRPIESRSEAEPAAPAPAPEAPDPALDAQLAALTARLAQLDKDFTAGAARADAAAKARGSQAVGSDQWIAAQASLAEIDSLRGDTLGAVSDLERLVTDRGDAGTASYPPLDAARAKAQNQLDAEIARIAAIKALLGEK